MSNETTIDLGDLERLLEYVKQTREFDFTGYKRPTLVRRVAKRMGEVGCATYAEYQDYLEVHPDEFVEFFNGVLINVTSFFRDPPAWEFLAQEVVPRIVSGKAPDEPIRVWSAGCASGEEAYTLAMVFAEALGPEVVRERVKVYATDLDEEALAQARSATYPAKSLEAVPEPLRPKYFEASPRGFTFRSDLRRSIIFGRHDLMNDAPISRLDLLACRNTLMYFNADKQAAILDRFRFALERGGYLSLGRAETLLTHSSVFRPLQLRLRIFEAIAEASGSKRSRPVQAEAAPQPDWSRAKLRAAAFDAARDPTIVVDIEGIVQSVNAAGRRLFGLSPTSIGQPLCDLDVSYRPLELRSVIEEATVEGLPVDRRGIEWRTRDHVRVFDVRVTPLFELASGTPSGVDITFSDVGRFRELEAELEQSTQELQTAYEELQSMNEELETMNEELQSTNDEFHVVNDMLNARGVELEQANSYLQSVLTGIECGVIVVDDELNVRIWNHWSEELWGLRSSEVEGNQLMNLDFGLPVADVVQLVRATVDHEGSQRQVFPARSRRGRAFDCQVTCSPMLSGDQPTGVIVLMEEVEADTE